MKFKAVFDQPNDIDILSLKMPAEKDLVFKKFKLKSLLGEKFM